MSIYMPSGISLLLRRKIFSSRVFFLMTLGLMMGTAISTQNVLAQDNDELEFSIGALIGTHNAALPISLVPIPGADAASVVTFSTNLLLKYHKAVLDQPADFHINPNSSNQCEREFTLPQSRADYSNVLGFWDTQPVPDDWGILGAPDVYHANTGVEVKVESLDIARTRTDPQFVFLDAGTHAFEWSATTEVDGLFDVALPIAIFGFNKIRWSKLFSKIGATGPKATEAARILDSESFKFVFNLALELGLTTAGEFSKLGTPTVTHDGKTQFVTVYDVLPPEISTETPVFLAEATDIGGAFYDRFAGELTDTIDAFDPCGRDFTLSNDAPVLLPLGESVITWTVTDRGPNVDLQSNKTTLQQTIIIEDTQAPILVPPPGKVIETSELSINVDDLDFGAPRVVDLADSSVSVSSDAPDTFERDSRTTVTWTATDDSGNTAMASQLVTLKEVGTNTAPEAVSVVASTLTAEPVDIQLMGTDMDMIDGVADPLSFDIQSFPGNGEFISPLLPFFINDYRTAPEGPWGEEFRTASNRSNWVGENICESENTVLPDDFVYNPKFFQVTDDGTQFITDFYWQCRFSSKSETNRRISKWDSEGNFLGSYQMSDNRFDEFVLDRDGNLYVISTVGAGSSTDLFLSRCSTDFGPRSGGEICDNSWKFNYASAPDLDNRNLIYARVDSSEGIAYVHDKRNIYLFDIRLDPSQGSLYLGKFYDGFDMFNCARKDMRIDIDSEGYVYANNSCSDRIYKYEPSYFDSNDDIVIGELVGWMGRCDTSSNNACDEDTGTTKGFSCTDATCTVSVTEGEGQGQFNTPSHIVLDPNDILYVADRDNNRIQRFGQDGTFAGEAKSTGTGINQGASPSFILGNYAPPSMVTVNSTQFFILDQDESFVHVFETSPLKDITDNSAVVTYVSDFSFHSSVDSFTYRVSDGLDSSEEVEVTVNVARNFRAPSAFDVQVTTDEDNAVEFELDGDDPDGILGEDFNGLDTLTWEVLSGPSHGRLEGSGKARRYTPDEDYYGPDSFVYVTNDGVDTSNEAVVEIEVMPVNDPPELSLTVPDNIAVGFPTTVSILFTDDDPNPNQETQHEARIEWGDGAVDINGELTDSEITGVYVMSPVAPGTEGLAVADYTYKFPDQHTIRACITDSEGAQTCVEEDITVKELVLIDLSLEQSKEEVPQEDKNFYTITLENRVPDSPVAGLVASDSILTAVLPQGMEADRVSFDAGCSVNNREIYCDLGDLPSGHSQQINIEAINDGTSAFTRESEFSVMLETSTPATQKFFAGLLQTVISTDDTDTDGDGMTDHYEILMGLDPESDDASEDLDGDGISNLEEFMLLLFANSADTDFDGIPDDWELENGLDPTSIFDGGSDYDGDGFSNAKEYLADRDPFLDEQTGEELVEVVATFSDNTLLLPTIRIGKRYFDIVMQVTAEDPLELQVVGFTRRNILLDVEDFSEFNPADNLVTIPRLEYNGREYEVGLLLYNLNPVELRVVSGLPQ